VKSWMPLITPCDTETATIKAEKYYFIANRVL